MQRLIRRGAGRGRLVGRPWVRLNQLTPGEPHPTNLVRSIIWPAVTAQSCYRVPVLDLAFLDAAPGAFPEEPETQEQLAPLVPMASLGAVFYAHAVIRTRFFDDYLSAATAARCRQVVLLAAGLDTRAFRLAWPKDTRVFEVDLPDVLAFKDTVLAARNAVPRCERTAVPADLRVDWTATLAEAGFARVSRPAWLAAGLPLYL